MSADKYPSIFSRQMETSVYIFLSQMKAIVYIAIDLPCLLFWVDHRMLDTIAVLVYLFSFLL